MTCGFYLVLCLFDYQLKGVELSRMADQEMFVDIKDVFVVRGG